MCGYLLLNDLAFRPGVDQSRLMLISPRSVPSGCVIEGFDR
jgi:hypothetical protein